LLQKNYLFPVLLAILTARFSFKVIAGFFLISFLALVSLLISMLLRTQMAGKTLIA